MRRFIIDVSSILRASHHAGKDAENGYYVDFEGKREWINSGDYAYEIFMTTYAKYIKDLGFAPFETVLVLDGMDSRHLRRAIYPDYKANRKPRPPELNKEYNEALEGVIDEITGLGGICCHQDLREADDVIAYLVQNLEGKEVVWSRDGDMLALQGEDTDILLKDTINPDAYKECPAQFVTLYKALVGDASDNFKGAVGFGKKTFFDMMMLFGYEGLENLQELVKERRLDELEEDVAEFAPLAKIIKSADSVYASWDCAIFYTDSINTSADPLQIRMQVAEPRDEWHPLMLPYAPTKTLVDTPAKLQEIKVALYSSPRITLDIETSTPEGSDPWCKAIIDASNGRKKSFVDVYGSKLTGMSLTFGQNMAQTVYIPVDHYDSTNLTSDQVCDLIAGVPEGKEIEIHNTAFELPVLYNEWGGFVEGAVDTRIMCSYANENIRAGLKPSSKHYFGYKQTSYEATTVIEGAINCATGGRVTKTFKQEISPAVKEEWVDEKTGKQRWKTITKAVKEDWERREYKMNELTAEHVFDYACDDTICTAALYNRLRFTMELEHTWQVFRDCELEIQYVMAEAFIQGIEIDFDRMKEIEAEDDVAYAENKEFMDKYLTSVGWKGAKYTPFEQTTAGIKEAFLTIKGKKLDTRVRNLDKLLAEVDSQGCPELAAAIADGGQEAVDELLIEYFTGEPDFSPNKDADLRLLMYGDPENLAKPQYLGLPIRFRKPPTDLMRKAGKKGTVQVDAAAVEHALQLDTEEGSETFKVLMAIREMKAVLTRKSLYYVTYPLYAHWKDGRIRPNLGQSKTATRRWAPSSVNVNQLPKKGEGLRIRGTLKAPEGYVYLAMDWSGQELRLGAFESQDPALLSCYIGDDLKDPHSLTGAGIALKKGSDLGDYDLFVQAIAEGNPEAKGFRNKGKGVNFSSQYLCRAPKLAKLLVVPTEEAQEFLDAKNNVYAGLKAWQDAAVAEVHELGYALTRLGARRHLHHKLTDRFNKYIVAEAERQAVNYRIQGSAAEMAKLAIKAMVPVMDKYGAIFVMPIHDEVLILVKIGSVVPCVTELHACMTMPYADMDVPLVSEISLGRTFGTLKVVGETPEPEKIQAVVKTILEEDLLKAA